MTIIKPDKLIDLRALMNNYRYVKAKKKKKKVVTCEHSNKRFMGFEWLPVEIMLH